MPHAWEPPEYEQIQGNIWPGFNKPHQVFVLLRFVAGTASAQDWLSAILGKITPASAVTQFKVERDAAIANGTAVPRAVWHNVAFSYEGIKILRGVSDDEHAAVKPFPNEFKVGMRNRADVTGDHPDQMGTWKVGGKPLKEAHALVVIAADDPDELVDAHGDLPLNGTDVICALRGDILELGREHFGFRDGVTRIRLDDSEVPGGQPWDDESKFGDKVLSGEFILGPGRPRYEDAPRPPLTYPAWATNGSFVVFRRLQQHVRTFEDDVAALAATLTTAYGRAYSPELVAAKLMGRWPSGAKLTWDDPPQWFDPAEGGKAEDAMVATTPADFEGDGHGLVCPLFSHIRKVHPRERKEEDPSHHRIIRRAVPYVEDGGADVGLLFLAYQASIAEQFEHIQNAWMNKVSFPRPAPPLADVASMNSIDPGYDPISGAVDDGHQRVIVYPGPNLTLAAVGVQPAVAPEFSAPELQAEVRRVPEFTQQYVSMTGGGYFFAPSIAALTMLAGAN